MLNTITIVIVFIVLYCLLVIYAIYLGRKKWPKTTESKISEAKRESLNEENLGSTIIEHEVKLIQKERDIEKLRRTLSSLEIDYSMFKYYKNNQYIFLGICLDQWNYFKTYYDKPYYTYTYMLVTDQKITDQKTSPTIYINDINGAALFTLTETQQLYSIFSAHDVTSVICNRDRYKLNKGTKLYDIIMTRIDNYYQNQIETVNKKLKNN